MVLYVLENQIKSNQPGKVWIYENGYRAETYSTAGARGLRSESESESESRSRRIPRLAPWEGPSSATPLLYDFNPFYNEPLSFRLAW